MKTIVGVEKFLQAFTDKARAQSIVINAQHSVYGAISVPATIAATPFGTFVLYNRKQLNSTSQIGQAIGDAIFQGLSGTSFGSDFGSDLPSGLSGPSGAPNDGLPGGVNRLHGGGGDPEADHGDVDTYTSDFGSDLPSGLSGPSGAPNDGLPGGGNRRHGGGGDPEADDGDVDTDTDAGTPVTGTDTSSDDNAASATTTQTTVIVIDTIEISSPFYTPDAGEGDDEGAYEGGVDGTSVTTDPEEQPSGYDQADPDTFSSDELAGAAEVAIGLAGLIGAAETEDFKQWVQSSILVGHGIDKISGGGTNGPDPSNQERPDPAGSSPGNPKSRQLRASRSYRVTTVNGRTRRVAVTLSAHGALAFAAR